MAKARNQWEVDARAMAERIERAAELGQQLTFLADEEPGDLVQGEAEGAARGRPAGAKSKVNSQMRDWLAARGYRLPEEVLVQMAGLDVQADAVLVAMERTERILAWAFDIDPDVPMPKGTVRVATPAKRLEVFMQVFTIQLRAAEAILPYGAAKASPDGPQVFRTTIVMPGASAPADPAASARDVTPRTDGRMRPPPLPGEVHRNQGVAGAVPARSDARGRTE